MIGALGPVAGRLGRARFVRALLGVAAFCVASSAAVADDLVQNGGFDRNADGWKNQGAGVEKIDSRWAEKEGRDAAGCVHVKSERDDGGPWIWRYVLKDAPKKQKLKFAGWIRGKNVQFAAICARASDETGKLIGFATTAAATPLKGDFDWTRVEAQIATPEKTSELHLLAFISGKGEAWFDDISMEALGAASDDDLAASDTSSSGPGPGVYRLRGEYRIMCGEKSDKNLIMRMPVPIDYREQVPLTYELTASAPEKLISVEIYEDVPGNFVAKATLAAPAGGERFELRWSALVLAGPRSFASVPKSANMPASWPKEALAWLKSTRCVQADDDRIKRVAAEIRGESNDEMAIIAATLDRMRKIYEGQKGMCMSLDAVNALEKKGSCTSCANLCAALLRANNIPARILAGYPAWYGALQTHYTVEAYVPEYGWYPIESTRLVAPWPPHGQIQVAIIPPEYEDKSAARIPAADGVPYLSLTEHENPGVCLAMGIVDEKRYCDHIAEIARKLPADAPERDWSAALAAGRKRWHDWIDKKPSAKGGGRLGTPTNADAIAAATSLAELSKAIDVGAAATGKSP